jgi:lysozyme
VSIIDRLANFFALAKKFEGCRLMPYYCPAGVLTCGWGSTGADVFPGVAWTQEYADKRLAQDAERFALGALAACPGLAFEDDAKLSAVTDFAYNLGLGRLKASTLRKRVNSRQWAAACVELHKWVNGGGRRLLGLVLRREAEAKLLMAV